MKRLLYLLALLLFLFMGVSCIIEPADEPAVGEISGPALLMFYTEN